jgi:hypothetical protein
MPSLLQDYVQERLAKLVAAARRRPAPSTKKLIEFFEEAKDWSQGGQLQIKRNTYKIIQRLSTRKSKGL